MTLKLDGGVRAVTGTRYGGVCALDGSGRLFRWSRVDGLDEALLFAGNANAVVPAEEGCCIETPELMCFGGTGEGREEYQLALAQRFGGSRTAIKQATGLLMVDPVAPMSRKEWDEISYLLRIDRPHARGQWFETLPPDNVFLRNAWLTACAKAPAWDSLCSNADLMFANDTGPIAEIVFGHREACVLGDNGRLVCVGPQGACSADGVDDVDVGTWSTCIANLEGVICWPMGVHSSGDQCLARDRRQQQRRLPATSSQTSIAPQSQPSDFH